MVTSAGVLLRERGVAGLTVDAVLARSGAPRGSVYHHFPGGRDELVLAAIDQAGDAISARLRRSVTEGDPRRTVDSFVRFWKRTLTDTDFRAGCPAVAVVVDGRHDIPGAAEAVCEIFARWHRELTALLVADGHAPARAERLATLIVAAVEGAILLARASGDPGPLHDVAAELHLVLDAADASRTHGPSRTPEGPGTSEEPHPPVAARSSHATAPTPAPTPEPAPER